MPLFDKLEKFLNIIFYGIEIIIVVSIVIVVIAMVLAYIKPRIIANKKREEYKSKLPNKYKNISQKDRYEICENLINLKQVYVEGGKALQKSAYVKGDIEIKLLVKAMTPDLLREYYEDKYQIELCAEYIYLDIEYLQSNM